MSVAASLHALLSGIVDYAGLFPPAGLELEPALRNFARYRQEPESWLLGRFICPVSRLEEAAKFTDLFQTGPPFAFSVLGAGGNTGGSFGCSLFPEEAMIYRFRHRFPGRVEVDRFEAVLPVLLNLRFAPFELDEPITPGIITGNLVHKVGVIVGTKKGFTLLPFLEVPATAEWRSVMGEVIAAMGQQKIYPTGFKLRCGGTEAASIPPSEQVAFVLTACRDAGIPLKFTAGLHHPLRHTDAALQAKVHGFVNVFTAGVLAYARKLTEEQLRPIVEDEDASNFVFDDEGLRWKDYKAEVEEIVQARQHLVASFGSCSFDEPRDDLRKLGWLA